MGIKTVYTNDGLELKAKMEEGASLDITRIVAGAGRVTESELINLTEIPDIKKELRIAGKLRRGTQTTIFAELNNKELLKGFDWTIVGILANDPDKGEIVYKAARLDMAFPISAEKDFPNFAIDCTFDDTVSNASVVNVNVDPAGMVTQAQLNDVKAEILREAGGGSTIHLSPDKPEVFKPGDLWLKRGELRLVDDGGGGEPQVVTFSEVLETRAFDPAAEYHAVVNRVLGTADNLNDGRVIVKEV